MTPIPILMYHSIDTHASPAFRDWVISPGLFEQHMAFLAANYTVLNVTQFVQQRAALPPRPVVLSFDDGFADFYQYAMPILAKYGLTATIYLTTGFIGQTAKWLLREGAGERPMLTWAQVRELHASGIECGAHTVSHPHLDTLPLAVARDEIVQSKGVLEQQLGAKVESFSYPYGHHISATCILAAQAGFSSACAVKNALSSIQDDVYALARITVFPTTTVAMLADLVAGKNLRVAPFPEILKVKIWRQVRRMKSLAGMSFLTP